MRYLSFILLIFFVLPVGAQDRFSVGPKLGIMLGAPVPEGEMVDGAEGSPILGHNLGIFINYRICDRISFQAEGSFNRKGLNFSTPIDSMPYTDVMQHPVYPDVVFEIETFFSGHVEGSFDNYYLEVPLSINYHLKNNKWSFGGGAYYAWLTKSNSHGTGTGTIGFDPTITEEEIDFQEGLKHYDWGVFAGTNYYTKKHISFHMRFSYGVNSIYYETSNLTATHNIFSQFTLSYAVYPTRLFN